MNLLFWASVNVAIVAGIPTVGCSDDELRVLAEMARDGAENLRKIAKRDIAKCVRDGAYGGTTVSGTMFLAQVCSRPAYVPRCILCGCFVTMEAF